MTDDDLLARLERILAAARAGLKGSSPVIPMGLPVVFECDCERERERERCTSLQVSPVLVKGERCVNLQILGMGGCVLSQLQRDRLADILNEKEWFGDHAELR
jgi:hypothetical protein